MAIVKKTKVKKKDAPKPQSAAGTVKPVGTGVVTVPRHQGQRRILDLPSRRGKDRPDPMEGITVTSTGDYLMSRATAKRLGLPAEVIQATK